MPPQVVQRRLGHKRIEITLGIYAHLLPSMQQDAARRLGHCYSARRFGAPFFYPEGSPKLGSVGHSYSLPVNAQPPARRSGE